MVRKMVRFFLNSYHEKDLLVHYWSCSYIITLHIVMNPKKPKKIRRSSSLNQGEFVYLPDDQSSDEQIKDFFKNIDFNESKRIVQVPFIVPDIKVNDESVESVTFHTHKNPLKFTLTVIMH